jgi:hypothetical protein
MDSAFPGRDFFDKTIQPLTGALDMPVIITSLKRGDNLVAELDKAGADMKRVYTVGNQL